MQRGGGKRKEMAWNEKMKSLSARERDPFPYSPSRQEVLLFSTSEKVLLYSLYIYKRDHHLPSYTKSLLCSPSIYRRRSPFLRLGGGVSLFHKKEDPFTYSPPAQEVSLFSDSNKVLVHHLDIKREPL